MYFRYLIPVRKEENITEIVDMPFATLSHTLFLLFFPEATIILQLALYFHLCSYAFTKCVPVYNQYMY